MMKRPFILLSILLLLTLACVGPAVDNVFEDIVTQIVITSTSPAASEKHCGDGVCDGPENASICPEDCAEGVRLFQRKASTG